MTPIEVICMIRRWSPWDDKMLNSVLRTRSWYSLIVHGTHSVSMPRAFAAVYFAEASLGTWNTQSLPVVMNDRINLVTFETRVFGYVWQEPQSKGTILITQATMPALYVRRLSVVSHTSAKGFLDKLQNDNVVNMRYRANLHGPLLIFLPPEI